LRYQHAADLRADLQRLKRDSDSGRSAVVSSASEGPAASSSVVQPAASSSAQVSEAPRRTSSTAMPAGPPSESARVSASGSRRSKFFIPVGVLFAALIAGGIFLRSRTSHAITGKDSIFIADFTNTTNDPVFDGTLKKALAVDLEQSPYLNVFSDAKARHTLTLMGKPPEERVTVEVAREICQRNGVKALLAGSIASLGSQYVVTLDAINASTGDSLAQVQGQADSKEQVLKTLDTTTTKLRGKLGPDVPVLKEAKAEYAKLK
jgi:hypothetical protein